MIVSDASPDVEGIETVRCAEPDQADERQMHRPMLRALKPCVPNLPANTVKSDASPDVEGIETQAIAG